MILIVVGQEIIEEDRETSNETAGNIAEVMEEMPVEEMMVERMITEEVIEIKGIQERALLGLVEAHMMTEEGTLAAKRLTHATVGDHCLPQTPETKRRKINL